MAARLIWTMALVAGVPLALHLLLASREFASQAAIDDQRRLTLLARGHATELVARLTAAEAVAQAHTAVDVGPDGALLRERIVGARAFRSVAVFHARDYASPAGLRGMPSDAQRLAVDAGQTALLTAALDAERRSVYLMRGVRLGADRGYAYFELAPDWLWAPVASGAGDARTLVLDASGGPLHGDRALAGELGEMFLRRTTVLSEGAIGAADLSWQHAGSEWHGAIARLPLASGYVAAEPWALVLYEPQPSVLALAAPGLRAAPLPILVLLLLLVVASGALTARYVPGLRRLREALLRAREGRPVPVTTRASDEAGEALAAWNHAAAGLRDRFNALGTLSEIDRLLLSSSELEQMLDAILSRLRAVTRCHSVGIALLDADSPTHGRVYVAWDSAAELPVSRVALDRDMLAVLTEATEGLTVARCEETRHSFLMPLKERGAELFWIWPVIAGERLVAILVVGYRDEPLIDAQVARHGAEFASRLAIALSNNARDEELYRQAHFDPLTGLPNRLLFRDRLAQELATAAAGPARGALLYIDLDHFKKVNDSVGHSAGDQLLAIVSQRLRACVKDGDTVARLGGDEFTVILRAIGDPNAARAIADRIIESLQLPVNIAGRDHFVRASIGITLFPDDGSAIEELMRNADVAMYRAKESGRGRAVFFDRTLMRPGSGTGSDSGLFRALRRRELSLFYQPQFELAGGRLVGLEALLRWQSPRDGLRYPREIVPAAEENGLIADIGAWVLETACAQLADWRDQGIAPSRLAINVSVQQLRHADFPRGVRRTLERHGLAPQLLELEVTEGVFADESAREGLERLVALGVRLTLDDFGTGYSSLNHLRRHPFQLLKIDRSFLEDVAHNPASATLAETIIVMAHALEKRVVAEGVETAEQIDFLRERGCDFAQGFFLAKPLATQAMTDFLLARRAQGADEELREVG